MSTYCHQKNQNALICSIICFKIGISGGAWATTAYSFAQNVTNDMDLLGEILMPHDITPSALKEMDPTCLRALASADLTFIGLKAYTEAIVNTPSDAWAYGVQMTYLEPVGIKAYTRFSWNAATVADIKSRNPELANEEFLLPSNTDRPYPIIGATLVGPKDGAPYTAETQNFTLVEFTPLYVGQMMHLDVTYKYSKGIKHTIRVGGAVESFAYPRVGSPPSRGLTAGVSSAVKDVNAPDSILDLQFAAGASSYAPGAFLESLPGNLSDVFGFPMDYYSPSDPLPTERTWLFSDGGSFENIPLISFLQRRVEKIVLFFNSVTPLSPTGKWDAARDAFTGKEVRVTVHPALVVTFSNSSYKCLLLRLSK